MEKQEKLGRKEKEIEDEGEQGINMEMKESK
jgi:hypothetical protein